MSKKEYKGVVCPIVFNAGGSFTSGIGKDVCPVLPTISKNITDPIINLSNDVNNVLYKAGEVVGKAIVNTPSTVGEGLKLIGQNVHDRHDDIYGTDRHDYTKYSSNTSNNNDNSNNYDMLNMNYQEITSHVSNSDNNSNNDNSNNYAMLNMNYGEIVSHVSGGDSSGGGGDSGGGGGCYLI